MEERKTAAKKWRKYRMKGEEETMCFVFLNNSYFSEGVLHSLRLSASLLWKISMFFIMFFGKNGFSTAARS